MLKKSMPSIVMSIAIVIASAILVGGYISSKKVNESISVTGLVEKDFQSDLASWEFSFSRKSKQVNDGYTLMKRDFDIVMDFINSKQVASSEISYKPIEMRPLTKSVTIGNRYTEEFDGYFLTQEFKIESKDISKIENLIKDAGVILESNVEIVFQQPMYFYTKLSDLKIEMVAMASEDGRLRAKNIAENAGAKLGKLKNANMGVFQITAPNSNDDYSWGGSFNTSSKMKRASLTMKMEFEIN